MSTTTEVETEAREEVLAERHEDGAMVSPVDFLGPRFGDYREAVSSAGARYVRSLKANVIALDRLPVLRESLDEAGFELVVAPDLRRSIEAAAEEAADIAEEGKARLAKAEALLAEHGIELYRFQRDGVRWMSARRRALLLDEMGLGKTPQALASLSKDARALVIAPASVAANWVREVGKFRPDLSAAMTRGKANFRWPVEGEVLVTTYGSLPKHDQEITMPPHGVVLIADECHYLKGKVGRKLADGSYKGGTKRVQNWLALADLATEHGGRLWGLSGTAMVNRPDELWRVLRAFGLATDAFGSWPKFVELFRGRHDGYGYEWGNVSAEAPLALQRVALRRERAAVLPDLPAKQRQVVTVEIDSGSEELAAADRLLDVLRSEGAEVDSLLDMGKLAASTREIVFSMLSKVRMSLAGAKIPAMLVHVEEYEEEDLPLVVFSDHVAPLKVLAERDGWALIDGSVDSEARSDAVERFQDGELRGLACSFKAGGTGLTMTRASHALCVDLPWTPSTLSQAEDRLVRIGQEADSVHIKILAADHPVDDRVSELLVEKAKLFDETIRAAAVEEVEVDDRARQKAEALAEMANGASEKAEEIVEERDRKAAERWSREEGRRLRSKGEFEIGSVPDKGKFRGPENEVEVWAAAGLVQLAQDDPDRANVVNNVGFSKYDNDFGHSLAGDLVQWGRLSDKQWEYAVKIARRYRRQVGDPPDEEEAA